MTDRRLYIAVDESLLGRLADIAEREGREPRKQIALMLEDAVRAKDGELDNFPLAKGQSFTRFIDDLQTPVKADCHIDGSGFTDFYGDAIFISGEYERIICFLNSEDGRRVEWCIRFTPAQWDGMNSFTDHCRAIKANGPTQQWFDAAKNVECPRCGYVIDFQKLEPSEYWTHSAISCPQCRCRTVIPSWKDGFGTHQDANAAVVQGVVDKLRGAQGQLGNQQQPVANQPVAQQGV